MNIQAIREKKNGGGGQIMPKRALSSIFKQCTEIRYQATRKHNKKELLPCNRGCGYLHTAARGVRLTL